MIGVYLKHLIARQHRLYRNGLDGGRRLRESRVLFDRKNFICRGVRTWSYVSYHSCQLMARPKAYELCVNGTETDIHTRTSSYSHTSISGLLKVYTFIAVPSVFSPQPELFAFIKDLAYGYPCVCAIDLRPHRIMCMNIIGYDRENSSSTKSCRD